MRIIDKDEAIKILCDGCTADCDVPYTACITVQKIIDMPTIEAEPVHHGYLIQPYPESKSLERCSVCGEEVMQLHKDYCGNCGAILDGGADNG